MIKTSNLGVTFGKIKALSDISLYIENDAQICGIIGPNGAGKSTFLSVIAGEINPTKGQIELFGNVQKKLTPDRANQLGIARTFQIPRPFYGLTVEENVVTSGLSIASLKDARRKAHELLTLLNLEQHMYATPGQLNLAGRKRLELAKALMTEPKILLSDELFEGLNDHEVDWLVDVMKNTFAKSIKVVMVEHVLSALRKMVDTVYVFNQGSLIGYGEVEEVLSSDYVVEAYLGRSNA